MASFNIGNVTDSTSDDDNIHSEQNVSSINDSKQAGECVVTCDQCKTSQIPQEYRKEHEENHRLHALCDKQRKYIDELETKLMLLKEKYFIMKKKRTARTKNNAFNLQSLTDGLIIDNQQGIAVKYVLSNENNYGHRYASLTKDPPKLHESVGNYDYLPITSIDQAVEPLKSSVEGLQQMLWIAKQKAKKSIGLLEPDESAAIALYSMEIEPSSRCFYHQLNNALQNHDHRLIEPWLHYVRLLNYALSKLPSMSDQTVYRGVTKNASTQYPVGMAFTWREFALCTHSKENLERFLNGTESKTIFKIQCSNAKDVSAYSCFDIGNEILLPIGCQFRVVSNEQHSSGLHIISMEEISSASTTGADQSEQSIDQIIMEFPSSTRIDLSGRQLGDRGMKTVVDQAIIAKKCTELDLGKNKITPSGALNIAEALNPSLSLRRLYLGGNEIADEGAHHLAQTMNKTDLAVLGLSENRITDVGAQYLAAMLKKNHRLTVLGLEDNNIGDQGLLQLLDALKQNRRLMRLLLAGNKRIDDTCVDAIIQMFNYNESLARLDLRRCNFSEAAKIKLQRACDRKKRFELFI